MDLTANDANYLALEPLLVARLQDTLPAGTHVLTPADLEGVTQQKQLTPAVHVVFWRSLMVPSSAPDDSGGYHAVRQHWLTVVAVRHAGGQKSAQPQREVAGTLAAKVVVALAGWKPSAAGIRRLLPIDAPGPHYGKGGYMYLPLAWETTLPFNTGVAE